MRRAGLGEKRVTTFVHFLKSLLETCCRMRNVSALENASLFYALQMQSHCKLNTLFQYHSIAFADRSLIYMVFKDEWQ